MLHLDKAVVVALLDADPLGTHPAHVHYAGDWVKQRPNKEKETSRVYAIESAMTISGSVADCRLGVRPSRIGAILSRDCHATGRRRDRGNAHGRKRKRSSSR